jgi:serpin B
MSNTISLVLGSALLVGIHAPSCAFATPAYAPLVAGNTDFALNLYEQIEGSTANNIFFSPYSISTCFGMVYAGARGETALQMSEALSLSTNQTEVGSEFGMLQADLNAQQTSNGITLDVANGLWAQTNFPFLPAFLDNASGNYDASIQQVDFITDAPQITDQINNWVAGQTEGMIPDLLQPGMLNWTTRLALINAIYFKGGWQSTFGTNLTQVEPFYVSPSQFVYAPLMDQQEVVPYYEDSLLQAAELPYTNSSIAMLILLPKTNGPTNLTPAELSAVLAGLAPNWIEVKLPKFKLDLNVDLVPILKNMGMIDAFAAGVADFSGIDGGRDLSIGTATHEAVIDVNETGTTAAGATAITVVSQAVTFPPLFEATHPFVFLLRDTNSGSILFLGRVNDPTSGGPRLAAVAPLIQTGNGSFGVRNHQFGFNVVSTNATVVIEACTNLSSGAWFPVSTLTLFNNSAYFSEPVPTNSPGRYYRVHSQ